MLEFFKDLWYPHILADLVAHVIEALFLFMGLAVLAILWLYRESLQLLRDMQEDQTQPWIIRAILAIRTSVSTFFLHLNPRQVPAGVRLRIEHGLFAEHPEHVDQHVRQFVRSQVRLLEAGKELKPIAIPNCGVITHRMERIDQYLTAVDRAYSKKEDAKALLSPVFIEQGFLAPLYLLTGLLAQYNENWRPILDYYGEAHRSHTVTSAPQLRDYQLFTFDCWLLWGPSIPLCSCNEWRAGYTGVQYGYGDEGNSISVIVKEVENVGPIFGLKSQAGPLHAAVSGLLRRGSSFKMQLPRAQSGLAESKHGQDPLVLENATFELTTAEVPDRNYYSAYLWAIFVVCDENFKPLGGPEPKWTNVLPFFEHGNLAGARAFETFKDQLAYKIVRALSKLVALPDSQPFAYRFRYVSAIDDTGCSGKRDEQSIGTPRLPMPGRPLREMISDLLQTAEYQTLKDFVQIRNSKKSPDKTDTLFEAYSSCRLPELVRNLYETISKTVVHSD